MCKDGTASDGCIRSWGTLAFRATSIDATMLTNARFACNPVWSDAEGSSGVQKSALKHNNLTGTGMESVRAAFHAQLATVMDSLLAAAVCEIAKIFESSLCEQQAELAHKTQEISILRGKLEKVERRQKTKGGGPQEGQTSSGDRENNTPEQSQSASGSIHVTSPVVSLRIQLFITYTTHNKLGILSEHMSAFPVWSEV